MRRRIRSGQTREPVFNDNPRAVSDARRMLLALGYDAGPSGPFDQRLSQALARFQRERGLPGGGNVTQQTITAMDAALQSRPRLVQPVQPQPATQTSGAPSFDCARAGTATERVICGSPRLAQLDVQLGTAFAAARVANGADVGALVASQRAWRTTRDACGGQAACVEARMTTRLAELWDVPGVTTPGPPSSAGVAAAGEGTLERRLAMPPAGLLPIHLRMLNGAPVFTDERGRDVDRFLALLALSVRPTILASAAPRDGTKDYAILFLPPQNSFVNQFGAWLGSDEFQTQDNRARFQKEWSEPLQRYAPVVPFTFSVAMTFDLSTYDAARGGFPGPPGQPTLALPLLGQNNVLAGLSGWPKVLLPMAEADARRVVSSMAAPGARTRRVMLVQRMEATEFDRNAEQIKVRPLSLALYDASLKTVLYEFPTTEPAPSAPDDGFARLQRPGAGLRPAAFGRFEGLPAFPPSERGELGNVLLLMQLGNGAGVAWERAQAKIIAEAWLGEQSKKELVPFGAWAGGDEFAQQRSLDTFKTRYLPQLKQLAPTLPMTFAIISPASLSTYNPERGGFMLSSPNEKFSAPFERSMNWAGLKPLIKSAWPEPFVHADPAAAEALLKQTTYRSVAVASVFTIDSFDAVARTAGVRLRSMSVYLPDLRRKVQDLPIVEDRPAGVGADSALLRFAGPMEPGWSILLCEGLRGH